MAKGIPIILLVILLRTPNQPHDDNGDMRVPPETDTHDEDNDDQNQRRRHHRYDEGRSS
ncbi:hypothetical protein CEXT_56651, partial [Caerostris extrusa]